jgi:hypothetical protein
MKSHFLFVIVPFVTLVGCSPMPSKQAGDEPPRLVRQGERIVWENAGSFGPVPERLAQKANITCAQLNTKELVWKPIGYHPKALGLDGKGLPGGGYYCKSEQI